MLTPLSATSLRQIVKEALFTFKKNSENTHRSDFIKKFQCSSQSSREQEDFHLKLFSFLPMFFPNNEMMMDYNPVMQPMNF